MKKLALIISFAIVGFSSCFASNSSVPEPISSNSEACNNPQVCQFSLNHYSGTVGGDGKTDPVIVRLSCPQSSDVYASVGVFINGKLIASDVIKVPANSTHSAAKRIEVPNSVGKEYELGVQ